MIKSERGSVIVFTLSACLLMVFVLVGVIIGSQNKIINQKKQLKSIENSYNENNEEKMSKLYEEKTKNNSNNTEENLKITTAQELKDFSTAVNNGNTYEGKTVMLMNDIDLSSICSETLGSWIPIGSSNTNAFKGTFNGRNCTISNLYIQSENGSELGLFKDNKGIIKNLKIQNAYVKSIRNTNEGSYEKYGILSAINEGEIISCKILSGSITDTNSGQQYAGGISGYNTGKISKCYNCATNKIMQKGGGIAGYNSGIIELSYNTAEIGNYDGHGGIVGYNFGGTVINCYNIGKVYTFAIAGGIVGNNSGGTVTNCYNIGEITATINGTEYLLSGGIVGKNVDGILNNCFYLEDTCEGGIGSTSTENADVKGQAEVKSQSELKALLETLGSSFKPDYGTPINNGYPILNWQ